MTISTYTCTVCINNDTSVGSGNHRTSDNSIGFLFLKSHVAYYSLELHTHVWCYNKTEHHFLTVWVEILYIWNPFCEPLLICT